MPSGARAKSLVVGKGVPRAGPNLSLWRDQDTGAHWRRSGFSAQPHRASPLSDRQMLRPGGRWGRRTSVAPLKPWRGA